MRNRIHKAGSSRTVTIVAVAVVIGVIAVALWLMPDRFRSLIARISGGQSATSEAGHGEHEEGHAHAGETDTTSVELSPQALKNIGFEPLTIALSNYERELSIPGMVVERPGRTQLTVAAPLGGTITKIYVIEGEAVAEDTPLFDIRLTHEELVSAQAEFLKAAEQLDVARRELARLEAITEGVIAGKRILEQKYEKQKIEGLFNAQREALTLHGLSDSQVDEILKTRHLLKSLTVRAPKHVDDCHCEVDHLFHIQSLNVQVGEQVAAGQPLCSVADHCELYIEGTAFEEDAEQLRQVAADNGSLSARFTNLGSKQPPIEGLKILYLADKVEKDSRAFHFYVTLPNQVVLDRNDGTHRFIMWRFKPGQRVELSVPVERRESKIVVPEEAVANDGAESFVYRQNGKKFDRVPVHVEFRDRRSAVLANDGSLFPGDVIAASGAFQIHLAIKNKSGGPIDPHAGHHH
jgi:multidrug efflux pump subunit AcrA (membrane-fusion protein)